MSVIALAPKTITTCEAVRDLSKTVGVRVHWRPSGVINYLLPEYDEAVML